MKTAVSIHPHASCCSDWINLQQLFVTEENIYGLTIQVRRTCPGVKLNKNRAWFKLALQPVERFSKSFSARFSKSRYKVSSKLMGFLNLAKNR